MSRKAFFILGLATLFGFSLIGAIILHYYMGLSLWEALQIGQGWELQLLVGFAYGMITSILAWELIKMDFLTSTRNFFSELIQELKLNDIEILFISFCAGVGEEILFRGGIQPFMGIWLTSVVFVAIHGYLNPKNWQLSIYGVYMCLVIVGIGYFCIQIGLISCIVAHFTIDVYLLMRLNSYKAPTNSSEQTL